MTQLPKLDRETLGLKIFPLFTLLGLSVIMVSILVSPTASGYWGGNAKTVRDTAAIGSDLLGNLATLQSIPKWLVPLAFLGVASFMTGIALEFAAIPDMIDRRTAVLKEAVPLMAKK